MKVLLILAAIPEFKVDQPFEYPIMSPPLTLLLLNSICKQAQHEVELIDTRLMMERRSGEWNLNYSVLESRIAESEAEVTGISFLSSAAAQGFRIAEICKKYGKTVVVGGLHASVAPEQFMNSPFDYVIQGEAEEEFPLLLKDLEQGRIPRSNTTAIVQRARVIRDLTIVPAVKDFSLYTPVFRQYASSQRGIYIETSRGCVKSCTFCEIAKDSGAASSPMRLVPIQTGLDSITQAIIDHRANYVLLTDSIATLYKAHFLEFVSTVRNLSGLAFQFNSTVDCWDEDRAQACQRLPCTVWFGLESASQRVLDFIKKGTTVQRAYEAARICNDYGVQGAFNILLGIPGETEEDYEETLRFFEQFPKAYPNPNLLNPLPGTYLYTYCMQRGLLARNINDDIWDIDDVKKTGKGPLKDMDYGLVLKYQKVFSELQDERKELLNTAIS
jgi:anaerobic magnesium-protoporphyrin IX monomethyl ester cyclase